MLTQTNLAEKSFEFSSMQTVQAAPGYEKTSQTVYKQTAVETASPEKLVVMLYNGALKFLNKGEKALLAETFEEANEALTRALDIVVELNATLNLEAGEIAVHLRDLYNFYAREIIAANIERDASHLGPVIDFFTEFALVWAQVAKR
ncbi:MAG: flagellar export chaperone FliS [Peptococcaceae bacterium]|nr:flagellar export chaperone FliS [Peptococcaceae bacterium]